MTTHPQSTPTVNAPEDKALAESGGSAFLKWCEAVTMCLVYVHLPEQHHKDLVQALESMKREIRLAEIGDVKRTVKLLERMGTPNDQSERPRASRR